ncbi:hypothetical protein [Methanobrevibacter olleyae]|uniref:hypothetical protein n=1 Tax=Methanobrevibacter olleyae TaxID=294671 RepID=UPI00130D552C|nr:hypothetical protein [Methanobrevibacter olleyae]
MPLKYAAELAGIHSNTIYYWKKKGEKAKSGKYRQFYLDLLRAKAKFVAFHVNKLNESDNPWTSKYLLEVTDPDTYVIEKRLKTSNDTNINFDKPDPFSDLKSYTDKVEPSEIDELDDELDDIEFRE